MSNAWTEKDEQIARERGFWITQAERQKKAKTFTAEEIKALYDKEANARKLYGKIIKEGVFLPAEIEHLFKIMEILDMPRGMRFMDLGSGDGRVAIVASLFGLKTSAFECDEELFKFGLDMERQILGNNGIVDFRKKSFLKDPELNLSEYDVIYYFTAGSEEEEQVFDKMKREMRHDAILVSYGNKPDPDFMRYPCVDIGYAYVFSKDENSPIFKRIRDKSKELRPQNYRDGFIQSGEGNEPDALGLSEICINEAQRILDAFLNQAEDIIPPEFIGFGWNERYPTREFLQAHLQEILSLAMNGQIVVHQLPDGTVRFIKLQEFYSVRVDEDIVQKTARLYDTRFPVEGFWVRTTEKGTFCPTPIEYVVKLMKSLNIKQGAKFIDLGSGDGRVAIMAKAFGMEVTAYEYNKELFEIGLSMEREIFGENGVIDFRNRDFMEDRSLNLGEYDVIYYFEAGSDNEEDLYQNIKREMRDDAILVVFGDVENVLLSDLASLEMENARVYSKSEKNPFMDDIKVNEKTEGSLILKDSPLSYLGRELGVNFYIPQSAKKEGFWRYVLDLTDEERRVLGKNDIATCYIGGRPTEIYIVFYNERPLYIVWHDKGMAFGYGLGLELSEEMKGHAKEWLEADLKSSVIFMEQLFQYVMTESGHHICCFKGVYEPECISSLVFQQGINPRKGARVLALGTGTGIDAIIAAERGAGEVVATDIGLVDVACAKFNVEQSPYKDIITVFLADLFNRIQKGKKFTHIYFNMPLDLPSWNRRLADPGMVLLNRLLDEAGEYLEEGGTLEINYEETAYFFERVYAKGWEPVYIDGVNFFRDEIKDTRISDYGRFILVRQKDIPNRKVEISEILDYWQRIAEIKRLFEAGDGEYTEKISVLKEIRDKYEETDDFNAQLLVEGTYDLARQIYSYPPKRYIKEPRINRYYPEYLRRCNKTSGTMKKPSVYSSLDEDNLRIAKGMEPSWRQQSKVISVEKRTIKGEVITAKFIDNDRDLPRGMYAYHFYDEEGNLVIVIRGEFKEEAIYHEAREAYWQGEGLTRRKAHIFACAEQVLAFGEEGELTPFHESQLENIRQYELNDLLDEFNTENRIYHHGIIKVNLGEDAYKVVERYERLFRMKVVLLLLKENSGVKESFPASKKSRTMLLQGLRSCSDMELKEVYRKVGEIEGGGLINGNNLKRVLLGWFDIQQLAMALGLSSSTLVEREKAGDIRSFISIKGHKVYHPVRAVEEYIYYEENKKQIVAERYLRSAIESLSMARFKQLVGFIGEETGISVRAGITNEVIEQVFSICKTWFTVHSLCRHLGVSKNTVNRIIRKWNLKTFTIGPLRGKKITFISLRSMAIVEGLLKELLDDIKIWYRNNFGEEIELSRLNDLRAWIGQSGFLKIFPFIKWDGIRNIPGVSIYKVKYRYFTANEYYIPPIVVERLKNKIVSWIREGSVFEVIKKHGFVQPDSLPEDLDYDKAKEIILRIMNEWLTIEQFAEKAGLGEDTVRHLIKGNEIDYIKLREFTSQFTYYIPPGSIQQLKDRDKEALERGKQFLESICGVAVPSLDDVRSLLSRHCVTSSQIARQLGISRNMYTRQRPNTVVLYFTGGTSSIVYWRKKDASAFIENERRKFEELKAEVGRYSDVSQIGTPKELIALLKREWKTPYQLAKEWGMFYSKMMRDVYQDKLPSVTINLVGYRKHVYIYPLNIYKLEKIVKELREFNTEWTRLGSVAQRAQDISRIQFAVPIELLKSAVDFTMALRKIKMLGKGETIFELIIYNLGEAIDGEKFIKLLNLPENVRVYTITKDEVGGSSDILQVNEMIQKKYPLRENEYLMIATDMVDKGKVNDLRRRLEAYIEGNLSIGIVVKPDSMGAISLSKILADLIANINIDRLKIILPVSVPLDKKLEEDLMALWGLLISA